MVCFAVDAWVAMHRKRRVDLPIARWQVDSAVLRLHGRRCTALEFHPVKVHWLDIIGNLITLVRWLCMTLTPLPTLLCRTTSCSAATSTDSSR